MKYKILTFSILSLLFSVTPAFALDTLLDFPYRAGTNTTSIFVGDDVDHRNYGMKIIPKMDMGVCEIDVKMSQTAHVTGGSYRMYVLASSSDFDFYSWKNDTDLSYSLVGTTASIKTFQFYNWTPTGTDRPTGYSGWTSGYVAFPPTTACPVMYGGHAYYIVLQPQITADAGWKFTSVTRVTVPLSSSTWDTWYSGSAGAIQNETIVEPYMTIRGWGGYIVDGRLYDVGSTVYENGATNTTDPADGQTPSSMLTELGRITSDVFKYLFIPNLDHVQENLGNETSLFERFPFQQVVGFYTDFNNGLTNSSNSSGEENLTYTWGTTTITIWNWQGVRDFIEPFNDTIEPFALATFMLAFIGYCILYINRLFRA